MNTSGLPCTLQIMKPELTKSEKRAVRELAGIAWKRQLREEIIVIGDAIREMEEEKTTPHDVNELIHRFHNGASRELYKRYGDSDPWLAICRAHYDGILTDVDIANNTEKIREGIRQFAKTYRIVNGLEPLPDANADG